MTPPPRQMSSSMCPFDEETRKALGQGVVEVAAVLGGNQNINEHVGPDGARISVVDEEVPQLGFPEEQRSGRQLLRSSAYRHRRASGIRPSPVFSPKPWNIPDGAKQSSAIVVLSRPSLLLASYSNSSIFKVTLALLAIAGGFLLVVEFASLILSFGIPERSRVLSMISIKALFRFLREISAIRYPFGGSIS